MKFYQHRQKNVVNQDTSGGDEVTDIVGIFVGTSVALFLVIGSALLFQYADKHWYYINEFLINLFK